MRFYLPASGTPIVAPTISADWEHSSDIRRPMSTTKGSTALASAAYTPDAADHLVNGDALHVQFVSDRLVAQTIAAQTVSLSVKGLMAHANNAQFLTWKLFIWTAAGAVGPTLLAIRRDATVYTTTLINRTDSATTTGVTIGDGDRLVFEVGTGGTPTAAGGTQGHNATLRWGESGATDAPANDTSTSTTENPWLDFTNDLVFVPPPATSGVAATRTAARVSVAPAAGHQGVARLSGALASALVIAVRARRAVVSWAQLAVPKPLSFDLFSPARLRVAIRTVADARTTRSAPATSLRTQARAAMQAVMGYRAPAALRARTAGRITSLKFVPGFSEATLSVSLSARSALTVRTHRTAPVDLSAGAALAAPEVATGRASPTMDLSAMAVGSPSEVIHASQGDLVLGATATAALGTTNARIAQTDLRAVSLVTNDADGEVSVQIPFAEIDPINLGYVYRGDTITLPRWLAKDRVGNTINLTGATLWFTAKVDLTDTDATIPTIQVSTMDGGIVILDAKHGLYQVTLQSSETYALTGDTVFTFDVQVITATGVTRTIRWGSLVVVLDVTRTAA